MLVFGDKVLSDEDQLLRHAGVSGDCTLHVRMRFNYTGTYSLYHHNAGVLGQPPPKGIPIIDSQSDD
jgi:hypothetical protein